MLLDSFGSAKSFAGFVGGSVFCIQEVELLEGAR